MNSHKFGSVAPSTVRRRPSGPGHLDCAGNVHGGTPRKVTAPCCPSDEVQTGIILWLEHDTHLENKLELAMVCCFDTNVGSFKAGAPLPVRTKLPRVLKPRNTSDQRWRQPLLGSDQNLRIYLSLNHGPDARQARQALPINRL